LKRYDIPQEGNEYYYERLRTNLSSFCLALGGVCIYSVVKSFPDKSLTDFASWEAISGLLIAYVVAYLASEKLAHRFYVFANSTQPTYRPLLAKFWFFICQLFVGVFCSFFFDFMFSPFNFRMLISVVVFFAIYFVSMNEFAKCAVKIANHVK